jgi:hypothetical protein
MKTGHLLLIVLLAPSFCSARTWRVEQDGSGDFTNIQPAVDASSPRDTVLVGPGRYEQFGVFDPPELHWEVIVGVHVDSLTIIGTDRESVIVGPTELYPFAQNNEEAVLITSIGIAFGSENTWGVVENMTFENTYRGIDLYPSGSVRDCTFRGMWDFGILVDKAIRATISDCEAYDCIGSGINVSAYGVGQIIVEVSDCRVEGSQSGYYFTHPNTIVRNSIAVGCNSGFSVMGGMTTMQNILSEGNYGGLVSDSGSTLIISNSIIRNNIHRDLGASEGGYINGTNLILGGGCAGETIYSANGLYELHNSHIGQSNGRSVGINYHIGPDDAMDLTGNYWGTTSADSIAAWIWDRHDDPSIHTTVQFEPFSPVPLPNENRNMGDVKAMFRGR